MQLTREIIINAAIELLNEYGLADMTMRRVATSLSVAPGALYWHVTNKQSLLADIAEKILSPVAGENAVDLALSLHSHLLAHRDGAELVTAALAQPCLLYTSDAADDLQPV